MTAWVFDSEKLEAALERHGMDARVIRFFLHSDAAAKLRVQPSPPSGDATQHGRSVLPPKEIPDV